MKFKKEKFKNNFLQENKAQSGAVFRLMIDAIIGLVIFAMILSTLAYFESLRIEASRAEFVTKVQAAVQSPNGAIIESDGKLFFLKGNGFNTIQLRDLTGYPKECFSFESNLHFVDITDVSVEFEQNVEAKLYVQCSTTNDVCDYDDPDTDCCEIECIVSFGKPIQSS